MNTRASETSKQRRLRAALASMALVLVGCSDQLDAGATRPRGLLPVDERSPMILLNDGAFDNWQGEYAVLLANGGGAELAAIVVSASPAWTDIKANYFGWRDLVFAARQSGLKNLPDPTASINSALKMPLSGKVEETTLNGSDGAWKIVDISRERALPYRPVVVATGGPLTDVADAYLIDPTVVDRVVVISSLGALDTTGAAMAVPNGEMDPWADFIVSTRFRYIQVSSFYDQLADVPTSRRDDLPKNSFGNWMRDKQSKILDIAVASDQVAVLAASLPGFVEAVQKASPVLPFVDGTAAGPHLTLEPAGKVQVVNDTAGALASARLWQLLLSESTFSK